MSDENKDNKVHGFEINENGHHGTSQAIAEQLSERQLKEMSEYARTHGRADVRLKINGAHKNYEIEHVSGGGVKIHEASHL